MRDQAARALSALAILCLAAAVGLGGVGLLIAALYLLLAAILPAAAAAALTGVATLAAAGLLMLLCRSLVAPRRKAGPAADSKGAEAREDDGELDLLASQLGPLIRRHYRRILPAAFGLGLILGVSPRARAALWRALERKL